MGDLLTALGLFLALEGALYAGLPDLARRMAYEVTQMDDATLRKGGVFALISGVAIVWLVRG